MAQFSGPFYTVLSLMTNKMLSLKLKPDTTIRLGYYTMVTESEVE